MTRRLHHYAAALIATALPLIMTGCQTAPPAKADAAAQQMLISKLKGKIKTNVARNHTISLMVEGQGLVVVKYNETTQLKNAISFRDLHPDEVLNIEYRTVGAENIATVISKVVAQLPPGATLMGLDETYALVQKGPREGNYVMFDSRPASRYHEGHIPGAISLPFADMEKADKEGRLAELLPAEKDKLLLFYCGGVT